MTDAEILQNWLYSMSKTDRAICRKKIEIACHVSSNAVYYWIRGKRKLREVYKKKINEVANMQLFE